MMSLDRTYSTTGNAMKMKPTMNSSFISGNRGVMSPIDPISGAMTGGKKCNNAVGSNTNSAAALLSGSIFASRNESGVVSPQSKVKFNIKGIVGL
jgi:hypothetical protein